MATYGNEPKKLAILFPKSIQLWQFYRNISEESIPDRFPKDPQNFCLPHFCAGYSLDRRTGQRYTRAK
jgi:hypothetical protein